MNLSTRIVVGWIIVITGAIALAFGASPLIFIGALAIEHLLRSRFEPRFPREVERRRNWILMPIAALYLTVGILLDVPESATHPLHVIGGIGLAAAVAWLIRDDIRVCRQVI
jgi:hypothetical protein